MGSSIPQVSHFQTQPTADRVVSQYVCMYFFSLAEPRGFPDLSSPHLGSTGPPTPTPAVPTVVAI